jgi:hypothetical protein
MVAREAKEVVEDTAETSQVSTAGEVGTQGVSPGLFPRGGGPTTMTRSNISSTSKTGREIDTTRMTSTYQPEGPWSGTMTTIGTN